MNVGPVFCVANKAIDFVDAPFKPGNGIPGNESAGWKFLYHNTCKSTVTTSYGFKVNIVTGNIVAINNILQGAQQWIVLDASQEMMTAPNSFIRNVLFSSASLPHYLSWRNLTYQKNPPTHLTAEQR